jgi:hypothetical protein
VVVVVGMVVLVVPRSQPVLGSKQQATNPVLQRPRVHAMVPQKSVDELPARCGGVEPLLLL